MIRIRPASRSFVVTVFFSLLVVPGVNAQTREDCLTCHSDPSMTMEKNGKERSIHVDETVLSKSPHAKLACIACHAGFDPENIPHKDPITLVNCLTCHINAGPNHSFHPQMMRASGIDGKRDVSCKNCHGTHDVVPTSSDEFRFAANRQPETCGTCHKSVSSSFGISAHGKALSSEVHGAPTCLNCHQRDITKVRPGRDSVQIKLGQEQVCLTCHQDKPDVRGRVSPSAGFISAYESSVHGAALKAGNSAAANCVDCHGSHEMEKASHPSSRVAKENIPATCSKCHPGIANEYAKSIHGEALAQGVIDAPACTNCHGEHTILGPSDPRSPVSARNVSSQVCSPCHASVRLSQKYGISSDRFATFSDSYHGLAIKGGSLEAANCTSCHGAHSINPSSEPGSSTHKSNLAITCGKCHPGANERFAVGSVHVDLTSDGEDPLLYWIASIYLILIITTIGGMMIHNIADFVRKARRKLQIRRGDITEPHTGRSLYVRMTLSERLQHGSLVVSFTILVITGFMLRYPNAWWVEAMGDVVFNLRSLLHRVAAVVMVLASLYHLFYVSVTVRGRQLISDLFPRIQDVRDAMAVVKYNFGFSRVKPQFGRFSYIEKSEYWALVWGTLVMAATGFVMWFDNTFIGLLSKLGYDVARVIHFYEAWLATLAIIVWHFYYVIFNPDVYPINLAFWSGKLTEAEMAEEHPLELEDLKARKEGEMIVVQTRENHGNREA